MAKRGFVASASQRSVVVAACLVLAGCSTSAKVVDDPTMPRTGNAFLVRGLMEIFSLGLNDVKSDLRAEGVNAHTVSGMQWSNLARTIAAARSDGRLNEPIVLVGHSYGADDAIKVARSLDQGGIPIEALVLIDPTTPQTIPPNVRRCFNIYKSSPVTDWIPVLRGVAVHADSDVTELINLDLRTSLRASEFSSLNHFDIEESPAIHAMIVQEVLLHCPWRVASRSEQARQVATSTPPALRPPDETAMGALDGREERH
jgi:pimeloyl-ACP methyl ester carboxylesterase